MDMISIAICDDEIKICEEISVTLLKHYGDKVKVSCFDSVASICEYVDKTLLGQVDIIIFDIKIKHEHGVDVAKFLSKKYPLIKFIFMSGYSDGYKRIFEIEPVYYLEKPINDELLIEAVDRAIAKQSEADEPIIAVQSKGEVYSIKASDIVYIESEGRILHIHTFNDVFDVYMKISDILTDLPDGFIKCHKSYCVNMNKIVRLARNEIELYNGQSIPMSRMSYMKVKEKYTEYVSR